MKQSSIQLVTQIYTMIFEMNSIGMVIIFERNFKKSSNACETSSIVHDREYRIHSIGNDNNWHIAVEQNNTEKNDHC
jgi:hypothetical protein